MSIETLTCEPWSGYDGKAECESEPSVARRQTPQVRCWAGCRPRRSCARTGRSGRCWCGRRSRVFAASSSRDAFLALATRDDARSRLVIHHPRRAPARRWERHDGPFGALAADMLPARGWTLLVNSVESLIPGGWEILRRFSFLPAARIDDLMISYAADGGSVGPHDDALRRVPAAGAGAAALAGEPPARPRASIRTRRSRCCGRSCPRTSGCSSPATCCTCRRASRTTASPRGRASRTRSASSRLRTPTCTAASSATSASCWGRTSIRGRSTRIRISTSAAAAPHEIGDAMVARMAAVVGGARWSAADVADFLGRLLTHPKPQVRFAPPARPLDRAAFARRVVARGGPARRLALALPSRGLVRRGRLFLNGEAYAPGRAALPSLRALLAARALPVAAAARARRRRDAGAAARLVRRRLPADCLTDGLRGDRVTAPVCPRPAQRGEGKGEGRPRRPARGGSDPPGPAASG